ncbi:Eukaryotic translation initiation factor 3 subunit G [Trinorchestia longiramus]|nr:Eukaryotic translation initiation factor 3 subunit G [Trinorchestia longiramus]
MAPTDEHGQKSSWADDLLDLPPPSCVVEGTTKTLTEYTYDENDKIVKVISTFRIEKRQVPKAIALRKGWKKYGQSVNDPPGPNSATTIVAEDVTMQFVTVKDEEEAEKDDVKKKLLDQAKGQVKCRLCREDHWTKLCPYKEQLDPLRTSLMGEDKEEESASAPASSTGGKVLGGSGGKYVPPSMREGANKRGESMGNRGRDDAITVRVTNLSDSTREQDLQDLFSPFGEIVRIYLARDKNTGMPKGFAFINFLRKEEAERAIEVLNGFGYDHLILNVEWARPSGTQS